MRPLNFVDLKFYEKFDLLERFVRLEGHLRTLITHQRAVVAWHQNVYQLLVHSLPVAAVDGWWGSFKLKATSFTTTTNRCWEITGICGAIKQMVGSCLFVFTDASLITSKHHASQTNAHRQTTLLRR